MSYEAVPSLGVIANHVHRFQKLQNPSFLYLECSRLVSKCFVYINSLSPLHSTERSVVSISQMRHCNLPEVIKLVSGGVTLLPNICF